MTIPIEFLPSEWWTWTPFEQQSYEIKLRAAERVTERKNRREAVLERGVIPNDFADRSNGRGLGDEGLVRSGRATIARHLPPNSGLESLECERLTNPISTPAANLHGVTRGGCSGEFQKKL